MWGDIGVLGSGIENFEISEWQFPKDETDQFFKEKEIKFVVIVEPVIKDDPTVFGYKKAMKDDIFIKDSKFKAPYVGN